MDDATLASLKLALEASPDNTELLRLVLEALLERGETDEAQQCLGRCSSASSTDADEGLRTAAAKVWLRAQRYDTVLRLSESGGAQLQLLRARALLALDRQEDARQAYERALRENATLQDPELDGRLRSKVREVAVAAGQPRLRVISNDDTAEEEAFQALAPPLPPVRFEDVGGLDEVKKQIHKKIILPFQKPSLFERFRKRAGGGILLYGPPGCGKTLLARATAGECDAQFFSVAISDVLDMYIGESERKLNAIFERARSAVPAVLFFDELEGLAGKRQFQREAHSSKLVSQFLSEMDGFAQNNRGVLVLGATNVPWAIDPAFRRPGRFDRLQFIPPPDREARQAILRLQLRDRPAGDLDLASLAKKTRAFSGADLEHLVESAADEAIEASLSAGDERPIEMEHFREALSLVKPTTLEWLTTARNYARYANEGGQYDEVLAFLDRHGR